jgi:hypothetical protein
MYGGLARSASPDFATIDPPSSPSRLADKDGWESSRGIVLEVSFTRLTGCYRPLKQLVVEGERHAFSIRILR